MTMIADDRLVFISVETDGLDGQTIGYACAHGDTFLCERWGNPSEETREYLSFSTNCERPSVAKLSHMLWGRVWVTHNARFHALRASQLSGVQIPGSNFLIDLNQCLLILKMAGQLQSTSLQQFGARSAEDRVKQMIELYRYIERKLEA